MSNPQEEPPKPKGQQDTPPKCCGKCPRGQCKYLKYLVDHKAYCKNSDKSKENQDEGMFEIDAKEYEMFLCWRSRLSGRMEKMLTQTMQPPEGAPAGCCGGCWGGAVSVQNKENIDNKKGKGNDTPLIPPPPSSTFCACSMINPPQEKQAQQQPQQQFNYPGMYPYPPPPPMPYMYPYGGPMYPYPCYPYPPPPPQYYGFGFPPPPPQPMGPWRNPPPPYFW